MLRSIFIVLALLFSVSALVSPVSAKTLYVDGALGSDAVPYVENSAETPWRTIGRAAWGSTNRDAPDAAEAAKAGDTVIVKEGTYSTAGTNTRWGVAYNTTNSGEAGAPIVFQADGTVILTLSSSGGPVIGASGFDRRRDYITWRGFSVFEANAPSRADTGPAVLAGTVGSTIEDCVLDGNGDPGWGDNHAGVRIEWAQSVAVRNCLIYNFTTSGVNENNGAGIQIYESGNVTLEHNEIHHSGSGIFVKVIGRESNPPPPGGLIIRKNHIHNIYFRGIIVYRVPQPPEEPVLIYQNVLHDISSCLAIWPAASPPKNAKIINNTILNCGNGILVTSDLVDDAGILVQNNIIYNSRDYVFRHWGSESNISRDRIEFRHNMYSEYSRFAGIGYTSNYDLSSWKNAFGQDSIEPVSNNANPLFVNAAGGDFRLSSTSPAVSAGVDYLDLNRNGSTSDSITLGAYISGDEIIGRNADTPISPPNPPTDTVVE